MGILFLTSRLPYPPNRGDRLRAFHFIEHLSHEHRPTLVSFIANESERQHVAPLRQYCQDVHVVLMKPRDSAISVARGFWRREPLQALYYRSPAMRRLVDEIIAAKRFDVAYVHLFRMAAYVAHRPDLYRIVDLTDVISREIARSLPYRGLVSRLIYRIERPRIARYERWVAQTFEETWLISESDKEALASDCPRANIQVVTNGVDTDQFHPTGERADPNSLIFVGHMRVPHNVDASRHLARDILPRVRREVPGATLKIVGANPAPEVKRLGNSPALTVTGFVPNLNAALNQSAVFVAPLRFAAGVQNKVLEAMATARPVVTTSLVNDGLRAEPGRDLLIADDAESTARQVIRLLRDQRLRSQIGQGGLAFVRGKYSWEHAAKRMRAIEDELAR
ncbi:MAG: TIGR03087 family PEP-CTERM/XrtA system glycosyltransferase [Anaerolineae bacterium]|jgi:sugar transferase (PEP-CTERM/EpsH1 system associated)